MTGMTDGSGSTAWVYDTRGRPTSETKTITGAGTFLTQWSYNSANLPVTMTYPGDTLGGAGEVLTFSYHPQKALDSFTSSLADYLQSTSYDEAGRVVSRSLGTDPITTTALSYYAWDASSSGNSLGRLWKMESGPSGSPNSLQNLVYEYDAVGNITQIDDNRTGITMTQTFTYDDLNRLLSATASGDDTSNRNYSDSYTYDSEGRLLTNDGQDLCYDDAAHVHAVTELGDCETPDNTYTYDDNGNQTQREIGENDTFDLTYDAQGRLVDVEKNSSAYATFVYDGVGQRVKATVNGNTSVYVGAHYEYDVTNTITRSYYAGVAMRVDDGVNNDVYWNLKDHLRSTSLTLNSTGGVQGELFYTAFGETQYSSGTTPSDVRYTGQREESDLGLYFYNARWYDPTLGHFAQADIMIPNPGNPQAFDRYAYVYNNPISHTDPSGNRLCKGDDCEVSDDLDEMIFLRLGGLTPEEYFVKGMRDPLHQGPGAYDNFGRCNTTSVNPNPCEDGHHPGVDGGKKGDPVFAAYPGTVVFMGELPGFGNVIIIMHIVYGEVFYTIYAHLASFATDLNEGDRVNTDTQIGVVGHSGLGDNPANAHLHFEARKAAGIDLNSGRIFRGADFHIKVPRDNFWPYRLGDFSTFWVDLSFASWVDYHDDFYFGGDENNDGDDDHWPDEGMKYRTPE